MMNPLPIRRPLGCLKTVLRRTRQARATQLRRSFTSTSSLKYPMTSARKPQFEKRPDGAFNLFTPAVHKKAPYALYAPPPRPTVKDALKSWTTSTLSQLDPTGTRTALFSRSRPDRAKVGDVLLVSTQKGEPFAGALMQIRRRGIDTAIQLRGNLLKTGVEMWFKVYSPSVVGIDIVWRRPKRARRARLMYLRHKKHDMGSVDDLVFAWRKERSRLRKGGRAATVFEPGRMVKGSAKGPVKGSKK